MINDFRKLVLAGLLGVVFVSTGCGNKNNQMQNGYKPMPKSGKQDDGNGKKYKNRYQSDDQDDDNSYHNDCS